MALSDIKEKVSESLWVVFAVLYIIAQLAWVPDATKRLFFTNKHIDTANIINHKYDNQ